ncbi:MAG: DUF1244 domain-containing protein [bacterium]
MPASDRTEIEAALFRKLIQHLQKYPEVQNIDLMNLAYFCRNCFSKWYVSEATSHGVDLDYDQARELIYGMPYTTYKEKFQAKASEAQLKGFEEAQQKATD